MLRETQMGGGASSSSGNRGMASSGSSVRTWPVHSKSLAEVNPGHPSQRLFSKWFFRGRDARCAFRGLICAVAKVMNPRSHGG